MPHTKSPLKTSALVDYYRDCYSVQRDHDEKQAAAGISQLKKAVGTPRGLKILDVGCGTGTISSSLSDSNEVHGIDCSDEITAMARKRGIQAATWDIEQPFPYADNLFDMVICRETFEHLLNPMSTLKQIYRILKPSGRIYATVPNHFEITRRTGILFGKGIRGGCRYFPHHHEWDYPHIRFFTYTSFQSFLVSGGFKIIKDCSPFMHLTRWIPWEIWHTFKKLSPDLFCDGFQFLGVKEQAA